MAALAAAGLCCWVVRSDVGVDARRAAVPSLTLYAFRLATCGLRCIALVSRCGAGVVCVLATSIFRAAELCKAASRAPPRFGPVPGYRVAPCARRSDSQLDSAIFPVSFLCTVSYLYSLIAPPLFQE